MQLQCRWRGLCGGDLNEVNAVVFLEWLEMKEAAGFGLETGHGFSHYSGGVASQGCAEVRVFNPADPFAFSLSVALRNCRRHASHTRGVCQKKKTHTQIQLPCPPPGCCCGGGGGAAASRWDAAVTDHSSMSVRSYARPPPPPAWHTADGRHARSRSTTWQASQGGRNRFQFV